MERKEKIAVVGAGLMGHGIAQVFAHAGHEVAIQDPDDEALARVQERVGANLQTLGLEPGAVGRIAPESGLGDAVRDAEFVFEAAPENLELKQKIFESLGTLVGEDTILASNTSVMSIGEIGRDCKGPGRVVGTHWWNPPYLVPLVEVVQAGKTWEDAVERTMDLLVRVGKAPVHVKRDVPGFVGNRLQHALWREAFSLIDAGVCDAETVDLVVKNSFGTRLAVLGPVENADLVGLDLTISIHDYLLPHLSASPEPAPGLRERAKRGDLGMKTGRGFIEWGPGEADAVSERLVRHLAGAWPAGGAADETHPSPASQKGEKK